MTHALDLSGRLYARLRSLAREQSPLPCDEALATELECEPEALSRAFNFLEAAGMVTIDRTVILPASGDILRSAA
ncbi:hypothetical protein [Qipengyuania sp.]|uniref:hypothetical protein n=1 Tax=Qipengyuania sp. TaxID=2004515 RepID=UPI0035C8388D